MTTITINRATVEQALEALEADCGGRCNAEYNPCWQREVAETLRAALAQQAELVEGNTLLKAFLAAAKEAGVTHIRQAEAALRAALAQQAKSPCACWPGRMCSRQAQCAAIVRAQQAEPVAGKVVAWGIFALTDGEWELQHPVFVGDECGKENAEFERASYSGPQPLEVRPLGVVTATAQQAEPVQEPAPMPPFPPVSQWNRGCAVCGIGADGKACGYVCSRSDCPTRVTFEVMK